MSALRPVERDFINKARFSRKDRETIDALLKQPPGGDSETSRIVRQLKGDYGLDSLDERELSPLIGLRAKREQLRDELGIIPKQEEGFTEGGFGLETHLFKAKEKKRIDEWLGGRVEPAIAEPCLLEIMQIERLQFIRDVGGVAGYNRISGILNEFDQNRERPLFDKIDDDGDKVLGYNSHFKADLMEEVATRMLGQKQVNILDAGCGKAHAFVELVEALDKRFNGHEIVQENGNNVLVFGNGKRLKLVGVNRESYDYPSYVNHRLGHIEDIGLGGPFDEIWDVFGAFHYYSDKKELLEDVYYPLLRTDGEGGSAGNVRVVSESMSLKDSMNGLSSFDNLCTKVPNMSCNERWNEPSQKRTRVHSIRIQKDGSRLSLPLKAIKTQIRAGGDFDTEYQFIDA